MISIEVFGGNNMMLFIIVCIFAYLVNGNQSIYGAQMKHLDLIIFLKEAANNYFYK